MTNLTLVVVSTLLTARTPAWREVPRLLGEKHAAEARIEFQTHPTLTNAAVFAALAQSRPTHVAFVMRPEEVDFPTVLALKRGMRDLDDDPYDDAKWGIVTGPTAEDARRIATSREPRAIRTALTTTGISDDFVPGRFVCLSDANPPGCWREKGADGKIAHHSTSNDTSHVFARAWNELDPDLLLTSAHASQRNLEMPFSRGNVVPRAGRFFTLPNRMLIDYATGRAIEGAADGPAAGDPALPLAPPRHEKVWLAAGNCLIADNLQGGDNMVMTALGFGKVNQFVGYMTTTWFGEIGWGTLGNFSRGMSLVDAYFAANEQLIRELEETVANAGDFRPAYASAADYDRLISEARAFRFVAKGPIADPQKFIGRLWDRDATVFYGDPLQHVTLKPAQ
ncbi:MAG: hypothetical protein ACI4R9_03740 [Kiritimatiellia bacterium]